MDLAYNLSGTFIEACNCTVICPCWVDDEPTEQFCAGLFAWTFAAGSTIDQHDVSGHSVVSVTLHGDARRDKKVAPSGSNNESAIFLSDDLDPAAADLLVQAFSGHGGPPLSDLMSVTGDVVWQGRARITVGGVGGGYQLSITASDGGTYLEAEGSPKIYDVNPAPMTLTNTALHHELHLGAQAVTAQKGTKLLIDVAALPGPPVDETDRSGMTGTFHYVSTGTSGGDEPADDAD